MVRVKDILRNLDLSKKEIYHISYNFIKEFDIDLYDVDLDKIELFSIRIATWYCTDQFVGTQVILYDDIPICISEQDGRKQDEFFKWISKELYLKTKEAIEKARIPKKPNISIINENEKFPLYYKLEFTGELIQKFHSIAFFGDKKVSVEEIKSKNPIEKQVKIIFEDGTEEIKNISELDFPIRGLK